MIKPSLCDFCKHYIKTKAGTYDCFSPTNVDIQFNGTKQRMVGAEVKNYHFDCISFKVHWSQKLNYSRFIKQNQIFFEQNLKKRKTNES